jgi:hypothetical protein
LYGLNSPDFGEELLAVLNFSDAPPIFNSNTSILAAMKNARSLTNHQLRTLATLSKSLLMIV